MDIKYDAIVIGGGVNGGAIAFNLSKRGMKVLLLEKDRLVGKASGAAAGMLAAQAEFNGAGPLFQLARTSRAMFGDVADELKMISGIDIELVNQGMLRVALTDKELQEFHLITKIHQQNGESAQLLTSEESRRQEPALSEEISGAMYFEKDGQVASPKLALGFIKSAAALGCTIKEYTEIHSFLAENGKIKGVATSAGDFMSDNVAVAGGAWSEKLLKQTGLQLSTYPVKGECFSVRTDSPLVNHTIFSHGCYLVPKKDRRIVVGATVIPDTFNQQVTVKGISSLMEKAIKLVPSIADAEWEGAWTGIRPQTADGLPYLGEHPEYQGLFIATGHFRNGILLSPITGEAVADLIERKAPSVDLSPFRVDRILNKTNSMMG